MSFLTKGFISFLLTNQLHCIQQNLSMARDTKFYRFVLIFVFNGRKKENASDGGGSSDKDKKERKKIGKVCPYQLTMY